MRRSSVYGRKPHDDRSNSAYIGQRPRMLNYRKSAAPNERFHFRWGKGTLERFPHRSGSRRNRSQNFPTYIIEASPPG